MTAGIALSLLIAAIMALAVEVRGHRGRGQLQARLDRAEQALAAGPDSHL